MTVDTAPLVARVRAALDAAIGPITAEEAHSPLADALLDGHAALDDLQSLAAVAWRTAGCGACEHPAVEHADGGVGYCLTACDGRPCRCSEFIPTSADTGSES